MKIQKQKVFKIFLAVGGVVIFGVVVAMVVVRAQTSSSLQPTRLLVGGNAKFNDRAVFASDVRIGNAVGSPVLKFQSGSVCPSPGDLAIAKKWFRHSKSSDSNCSSDVCDEINQWFPGSSPGPGSCDYYIYNSNGGQSSDLQGELQGCERQTVYPQVTQVLCIGD